MPIRLPFTEAAFLDVFGAYNATLWPAVVALWAGTLAASVQFLRGRLASRPLVLLLAYHWAWSAIAYHALFFTRINPAARLFAALFAVQAALFLWWGFRRQQPALDRTRGPRYYLGATLIVYSLVYPGLVLLSGHTWPRAPTFGVPCPSVLFTAGVLLAAAPPPPRWLLVVPVLWTVIGGSAALLLSMPPDLMLFVAGAALLVYAIASGRMTPTRAA